ncbi:MAG: hypothetical protein VKP62_09630 [Candidatus Sericytochromatia bacterium]|nr:hypothetical protein [Candidatus Sericytochromatia bacterium]
MPVPSISPASPIQRPAPQQAWAASSPGGGGTPASGDHLALSDAALGSVVGTVAGTSASVLLRVHPGLAVVAGTVAGAAALVMAGPALRETVIGRHTLAASFGSMAGGGALAIGALTLGATSGAVVAGAGLAGAALGAYGLARLVSLVTD